MTQPDDGMSPAYHADDIKLKVAGGAATLTDEEARAWLAQTVPAGETSRTIDTTKEVQGA